LEIPPNPNLLASIQWDVIMLPLIIGFVLLILLLACSALISGSEVAFFSLSPAEIEEIENKEEKASKLTISLLDQPKDLLAIILITNNFINVGIIILSTFLSSLLFPPESMSSLAKFLIDVIAITFLLLLFGEVIPKIYATKHGKQLSLLMAKPLYFIGKVPPFSWLKLFLVKGTSVISNLGKKKSLKISSDELNDAVELTIGEEGDEKEKKIWKDIVKFGEKDVKQIMKGRVDVDGLDVSINFKELYERLSELRYSRIPVYEESFDNIKGILFVKDLLPYIGENENFEWQSLIREPYFVPENKKIDDLMNNFQEMKMHMAIVVDEYGGKSGIVTLEDVLEEIVGDIADEFDEDDLFYSKLDEFNYVFEGKTPLVDIYKVLGIEGLEFEEAKSESDTLAGFVIEQAGKILKKGERIQFSNFVFQIEAADTRKVKRIKITIQEQKKNDE
jgi:gliding motility-associated protein GldE